jgi:hypothetical protein
MLQANGGAGADERKRFVREVGKSAFTRDP